MNAKLSLIVAAVAGATATLIAMNFAATAAAQTTPNAAQPAAQGQMYGRGQAQMHGRGQGQAQMGGQAESLVGMAAAKLNLTQAELIAQLGDDGTIAAALTAGSVDPVAFIDEFVASRKVRLDAAVAAGTMTQADADARLATAQSMSTARIYQPFTALGPGGQGPNAGSGSAHPNFVDENGDGVCDTQAGGQHGPMGGGRGRGGPNR